MLKIGGGAILGFFFARINKRLDKRQETREKDAARTPKFIIERSRTNWYRLVNAGDATATEVTLILGKFPEGFTRHIPKVVTLAPAAAHDFFAQSMSGHRLPGHFMVSCKEIPDPIAVTMPVAR
ncbi:hypothetical protein [Crossiella sp. CA198]|uniref:hypothetical protein n=1 Tax=Crossiella sp. CA198 TaxID=3455607 RepID=UPI003F8D46F2